VGRQPEAATEADGRLAAMVVTTDAPVPAAVIEDIVATDGFVDGRTVAL
jgi:D-3-phosphoglycerate dehydrogenase / 2-oxoglutarate reductase